MQLVSLVRGVALWTLLLSSSCSKADKDPLDFGAASAKPTAAAKTNPTSKPKHVQKKTLLPFQIEFVP